MTTRRVLVLTEPGRRGGATVHEAGRLACADAADVTIVGVAPQASGPRCGTSIRDYNTAIIATVAQDLARARANLAAAGVSASIRLLVEGRPPSLEQFAVAGGFDLLLLPSRSRLRGRARHPAEQALRASTRADVRVLVARQAR